MIPTEQIIFGTLKYVSGIVANHFTKPDYEQQKKTYGEYYDKLLAIAEGEQKQLEKEKKKIIHEITKEEPSPPAPSTPQVEGPTQIQEGTACLPCSQGHLSTASAMLKEAIRFGRRPEKGIRCFEVRDRIATALEELNAMERLDLVPQKIEQLQDKEKKLAVWTANKSGELRHIIADIRTLEDLEHASAVASKVNIEFTKVIWDVQTVDNTIDILCKKLDGIEKQKCMESISTALQGKIKPLDDSG